MQDLHGKVGYSPYASPYIGNLFPPSCSGSDLRVIVTFDRDNKRCEEHADTIPDLEKLTSLSWAWRHSCCDPNDNPTSQPNPDPQGFFGGRWPKKKCLNGDCRKCGGRSTVEKVHEKGLFKFPKIMLMSEDEAAANPEANKITTEVRYYKLVPTGEINKKTMTPFKKLTLIRQMMNPREVAEHFVKHVLKAFPGHQFRAVWMHEVYINILKPENLPLVGIHKPVLNLSPGPNALRWLVSIAPDLVACHFQIPKGEAVCVMDFSENHTMDHQSAPQSCHWCKTSATLHIMIVWRHARKGEGGDAESTKECPRLVKEIHQVISDDPKHDHHFVLHCQKLIYLDHYGKMGVKFTRMHEFTDGCAGQYKNRDVLGSMATIWRSIFYFEIIRYWFEVRVHLQHDRDLLVLGILLLFKRLVVIEYWHCIAFRRHTRRASRTRRVE
jgi:hypothetical protein